MNSNGSVSPYRIALLLASAVFTIALALAMFSLNEMGRRLTVVEEDILRRGERLATMEVRFSYAEEKVSRLEAEIRDLRKGSR